MTKSQIIDIIIERRRRGYKKLSKSKLLELLAISDYIQRMKNVRTRTDKAKKKAR